MPYLATVVSFGWTGSLDPHLYWYDAIFGRNREYRDRARDPWDPMSPWGLMGRRRLRRRAAVAN